MGGGTSLAHTDADIEHLSGAFEETLKEMIAAGTIQQAKATRTTASTFTDNGRTSAREPLAT